MATVKPGALFADLPWEFAIQIMEAFIAEPVRCCRNADLFVLARFSELWPKYVEAVNRENIQVKWIGAREVQGGKQRGAV